MVSDALMERISEGGARFDQGGLLALQGQPDIDLLDSLLEMPFFGQPPPKSTGREAFGAVFAETFYLMATARRLGHADMLATAAALTVESIGRAYEAYLTPRGAIDTVILGGGGVQNRALTDGLARRLYPARITSHAAFGMPDEAKEAAAFALLGYATLCGRPSNVPSATGAQRPAILGKISFPPRAVSLRIEECVKCVSIIEALERRYQHLRSRASVLRGQALSGTRRFRPCFFGAILEVEAEFRKQGARFIV